MKNQGWRLIPWMLALLFGVWGGVPAVSAQTDEAMIREIQQLDPQIRQQLAADMIGGLQQPTAGDTDIRPLAAGAATEMRPLYARDLPTGTEPLEFQVPELNEPVKEWEFQVRDEQGRTVKTYSGLDTPPKTFRWDRKNDSGQPVLANNKFNYILKTQPLANVGPGKAEANSIRLEPEKAAEPVPIPDQIPIRFADSGMISPTMETAAVIERASVRISRQPDGHILITTGDRVYFPTPSGLAIRPREIFRIFKRVEQRGRQASAWYEQVGRLRVLAVQGQLSIGLIVSARDIISEGDAILLDHP